LVNDALDSKMKIVTVFFDILKTFATVDHGILLKKLENCGVRGNYTKEPTPKK